MTYRVGYPAVLMVGGDIYHLDESDIQWFRSGIFTAVKNTGIFHSSEVVFFTAVKNTGIFTCQGDIFALEM